VLLLTPLLGVAGATAVALLARVVHTVADGVMAVGWWYAGRRRPAARQARARRLPSSGQSAALACGDGGRTDDSAGRALDVRLQLGEVNGQ
jgi:hypothetical protein